MYILVQHSISEPVKFLKAAEELNAKLPASVKLHHVFSAPDGTKAVCVWEASTITAVKDLLEPATAKFGRNDYFEVPNKEGIVLPTIAVTA
jgi:hypothetical protein